MLANRLQTLFRTHNHEKALERIRWQGYHHVFCEKKFHSELVETDEVQQKIIDIIDKTNKLD